MVSVGVKHPVYLLTLYIYISQTVDVPVVLPSHSELTVYIDRYVYIPRATCYCSLPSHTELTLYRQV